MLTFLYSSKLFKPECIADSLCNKLKNGIVERWPKLSLFKSGALSLCHAGYIAHIIVTYH